MAKKEQKIVNSEQKIVNSEQKIQTKYDRKMEERKKQEVKDKRNLKLMRITAAVMGIVIVVAIAGSITISVLNKREAVKKPYVTIGSHAITKLEYDYYYHTTVNSYLQTYASIIQYMGLDTTVDYDKQQYSDTMTWKDLFDQMTVEQISRTKAMVDDAAENSFVYDAAADYKEMEDGIQTGAAAAGQSVSEYYTNTYGSYASQSSIEPIIKDGLLAAAYYEDLIIKNKPSEQEVKDYYTEHMQDYDKIDYRSFVFKADAAEDASEEDITKAMAEAKKKADAMLEARLAGSDFKELSIKNASEEEKAGYTDTADASLHEGQYASGIPVELTEWLYAEGRVQGDCTVIEDSTGKQYTVAEFANRYFDESDNENISNTIAGDRVEQYVTEQMKDYTVTDNKGDLKYLTVEQETGTEDSKTAE